MATADEERPRDAIERVAYMTTCPRCGQGNDRRCVTRSGYFTSIHAARWQAANDLYTLGHRHGYEAAKEGF